MIKKSIAVIVALILSISSLVALSAEAFAAECVGTVYSDTGITATVGDTVRIPIKMKDCTGILGWRLIFEYDATVFEPVSIDYGSENGCIDLPGYYDDDIAGNSVPGRFSSFCSGGLYDEIYEGTLFVINMKVKDDYLGNDSSVINISYNPDETFNDMFEDVALNCESVNVKINFGSKSFYQMNMKYAQWDGENYTPTEDCEARVTAGDKFAVYPVLDSGELSGICKVRFTYNSDNFDFLGYLNTQDKLDTGLKVKNDGIIEWSLDYTNPEQPKITDTLNNVELTGGADTNRLAFKAKGNAFRGNYEFKCETLECVGIDEVRFKSCFINVGMSADSEIATLYNDNVITGKMGETITVPVYIKNNHGLMGYKISVNYDEALLKPVAASTGKLFKGDFAHNIGYQKDETRFSWVATENYAFDDILLNIKFQVLTDAPVDSSISFNYSQPDTFNEQYEDVVLKSEPIEISLNKPAPVLDDFKFKTVSLSLESSITMNFKVLKAVLDEYSDYSVRFSCADLDDVVVTEYKEQGNYYVFSYKGISPQMMNDDVTATLTATYNGNGKTYTAPEKKMSVREYSYALLDRYADNVKLRTLLVDLLNYGAAAQEYRRYQWNAPVNADLTDLQKSWGTSEKLVFSNIGDFHYKTIENPTAEWTAAGLVLNDAVTVRAKLKTDSVKNKTVTVTCNGRTYTYTSEDFVDNGDGTYYVYCDGIYAHEMSRQLLLTVYDGDVQCSDTMRYSIESYASAVQNGEYAGTSLDNLTQNMMRYGKSAEAYGA